MLLWCLLLLNVALFAQKEERLLRIEKELTEAAKKYPGLNNPVDISVNNYTIGEVIRAIASENNLNVVVDPSITQLPSYNFSNASVKDVFLFFCKENDLDIVWTGNIMAFKKVDTTPVPQPVLKFVKVINLAYDKNTGLVEADLQSDTLYYVLKKLSSLSEINIDLSPELHSKIIQKHIVSLPFEEALKVLIGDEEWVKMSDKFYKVNPKKVMTADQPMVKNGKGSKNNSSNNNSNQYQNNGGGGGQGDGSVNVEVLPNGRITLSAQDAPIADIIKEVSARVGVNYYMFKEPTEKTTVNIVEKDYEQVLKTLFNGSNYTYNQQQGIYLIGDRSQEGLRNTIVIQLQHRTATDMKDFIPANLKKDVELILFEDQNSLVLSGSAPMITELQYFIKQLDKVVPVILIEVMIVDVNKSLNHTTGVKAGFKNGTTVNPSYSFNNPASTGVGVTVDGSVLNNIINSFNGFGIFNLGLVSSDFYLSIEALESNGYLKKRSTPKLATLNGHEATMSIGRTEYYVETTSNIIGTLSPTTQVNKSYKPVVADLSLKIKPIVSGDGQITLEIEVQQADFTDRVDLNAPPGSVKRKFSSMIRVKDQEMVILGGLEESKLDESGSGIPFLNRIPVLKWLFSSRSRKSSKSKLNIFIKPTIIY